MRSVIDPEGNTVTNRYDGAARLIETKLPSVIHFSADAGVTTNQPTTTIVYDLNSNKELVTDPNGNQTKMFYDARNRLTNTVVDLNGNGTFGDTTDISTVAHYDLTAHVIEAVDANGNATDMTYDKAYRVIVVTGPAVVDAENNYATTNPVTRTTYDKNSNVTSLIDPRGVVSTNVYDQLNRARSVTRASGASGAVTTVSEYDANNSATKLVLSNVVAGVSQPQATTYSYDVFDRKTNEVFQSIGDGNTRQNEWVYYRNGTTKHTKDAKGQRIESEYDRASRSVTNRFKQTSGTTEETRAFSYNKTSKLLTVADLNGTTTNSYDAVYRLLTETRNTSGQAGYTVTSSYDANHNRTKCVYPGTSRTLVSRYDRANRLSQIDDGIKITTYTYDKNGNRTGETLPNSVVTANTYDTLNRPLTMASTSGGNNIYNVIYDYDQVGNRRSIIENLAAQGIRTNSYNYDSQYRLTSESSQSPTLTNRTAKYNYDLAGNRLTYTNLVGTTTNVATSTYDDLNRLRTNIVNSTSNRYSYDLNGNRTNKTDGVTTTAYGFDVLNRLTSASTNGVTVFVAAYDYRTRRLTKDEGTPTYFRYDGGDSFQELTNATIQVEFVRGSGMGGGIGSILYRLTGNGLTNNEFFTYNAVGHTVAMTGGSGVPTKTDLYEAFGKIISSTGSSANNRLANTKERDFSIGLDNHGFRYFDPEIGRYISRDPLGYKDGMDCYLYVHNNPINHIDPLGLDDASIMEGLGRGLENAFLVAKGMTFDAGQQTMLSFMDASESDPSNHKAAVSQVYDSMLNENTSGVDIAKEPVLQISGYRFGNQIREHLNSGKGDELSQDLMYVGVILLGPKMAGKGKPGAEPAPTPKLETAPEKTVTRYMGKEEAQLAKDSGEIPNVGPDKLPRPTHVTTDAPLDSASKAQNVYELPKTPTHRATVPADGVGKLDPAPSGPKTSGGGSQNTVSEPIPVKPEEIKKLGK